MCVWAGKLGKAVPTFLGYLVHEGATLLADSFVRNTQLPVVLDLDETLLVANSLSQLESQMAKAKEGRYRPFHKCGGASLPACSIACKCLTADAMCCRKQSPPVPCILVVYA